MKPIWMAVVASFFLLAAQCHAGESKESLKKPVAEDVFNEDYIPRFRLELSNGALNSLRQRPRTYVLGTIREGGSVYTNVSIRLKGGPGSFRNLDDKPAFTLNFGKNAEGQTFHGLRKLHLNNSVQDHTFMSEKICRELFTSAGVPTPRAGHATVKLNGDNLGFYVLIEGMDKHFLKRYFKDAKGNVYDGHSGTEVTGRFRTNSGENPRDQSRLAALAAAVQEPNLTVRLASLEKTLDLDRFLSYVAMEVMTCHWDGYSLARNNYRIFHDRDQDKMVFIPQGTDQMFQRQYNTIFPQMQGLVSRSVLQVPELRERYHQRSVQLLTNVFQMSAITNRILTVAAKIQPVMAEADPEAAANYPQRALAFGRRIQRRVNALEHQLLAPAQSLAFGQGETVTLTDWQPQLDLGHAAMKKEQLENKTVLHIHAEEKCAASWRNRVVLESGHYRLEARAKLTGVKLSADDPKGGAGLRMSHRKFSRKLSGDTDWTVLVFDFDVQQDHADAELVCELRAEEGDIWFDLASLRLVRSP